MSTSSEKIIPVGKIGAPHGVDGWLKVFSQTDPADNLLIYQPWLIKQKDRWRVVKLLNSAKQPKNLLAQFEGIQNRDQAAALTNALIGVYRSQLPALAEGQYYWADLEGLRVSNLEGFEFGVITELMATGANDVMYVQGKQLYCLPYLPDRVIKKIDLEKGTMLVDWPSEF